MELRFVQPDLRRLDLLVSEVLAVPVCLGERPPRGTAGLLDYRLAGRISAVLKGGTLTGEVGEKVFLSGRPKLPFDKLLLFGVGELTVFNQRLYAGIITDLLKTLEELNVRRAVVELPGRKDDLIEAQIAAEILLECAGETPMFDTWTLVDTAAAQRSVTNLLRRDRRNDWRMDGA